MNIQVARGAQLDFDQAYRRYELAGKEGLTQAFCQKITDALLEIAAHPRRAPSLEGKVRRVLVRRFPYGILYVISGNHVRIIAIMHLSRRPGYWRTRVTKK
jgi:toxin ParE1/3/4